MSNVIAMYDIVFNCRVKSNWIYGMLFICFVFLFHFILRDLHVVSTNQFVTNVFQFFFYSFVFSNFLFHQFFILFFCVANLRNFIVFGFICSAFLNVSDFHHFCAFTNFFPVKQHIGFNEQHIFQFKSCGVFKRNNPLFQPKSSICY